MFSGFCVLGWVNTFTYHLNTLQKLLTFEPEPRLRWNIHLITHIFIHYYELK